MNAAERQLRAVIHRATAQGDMELVRVLAHIAERVVVDDDGCWLWTGGKNGTGYGRIQHGGRHCMAHRVVYELLAGPLDDALTLDHLCCKRACVNPKHLDQCTLVENIRRGWKRPVPRENRNTEKTHCPRGHEYMPANTYRDAQGWRRCRTCMREAKALVRQDPSVLARHREASRRAYAKRVGKELEPRPVDKTHCRHGHEFTEATTYRDPRGHRSCRICRNESGRRSRARKHAA